MFYAVVDVGITRDYYKNNIIPLKPPLTIKLNSIFFYFKSVLHKSVEYCLSLLKC